MLKKVFILLLFSSHVLFSNLIINEIMPAPTSPEPEWIELFNYGLVNISIDTLFVADPSKTTKIINFNLAANSYTVISSDTTKLKNSRIIPDNTLLYQVSLPTFNNTSDYCKIYTSVQLLDSLYYDMDWGISGKSFERILPQAPIINGDNLKTSLDSSGATAGRENSKIVDKSNYKTSFRINEIMFDVSANAAEYIELYNYSNDTANLKFCKFADATDKGFVINEDVFVPTNKYFVIFWDSLLFNKFPYLKDSLNYYYSNEKISLNNDGDIIAIRNFKDSLIDSVQYNSKWHNPSLDYSKDISLEKINEKLESYLQSSWNSSTNINGGTPGKKNSYMEEINSSDEISISPNPFSISKSGDLIKIEYIIPYQNAKVNIRIFDTKGYLVSHPLNNQFLGRTGLIELKPIDKYNNNLIPQAYIIQLEATDTQSGSIFEIKKLFVVAA